MEAPKFAGRRIKVSAETRLVVRGQEHAAQLVALSPSTALVHASTTLGAAGDVIELYVPVSGSELKLTAGIDRAELVKEGWVASVTFMFDETHQRKALDDLVSFLLGGGGGGQRQHPRITYRVPVRYGENAQVEAELIELSMSGALIQTREALAVGAPIALTVPHASGHGELVLQAEVRNHKPAEEQGWFAVGIAWKSLADDLRAELSSMLRALLTR